MRAIGEARVARALARTHAKPIRSAQAGFPKTLAAPMESRGIAVGVAVNQAGLLPRWLGWVAILVGPLFLLQGFGLGGVIASFGLVLDRSALSSVPGRAAGPVARGSGGFARRHPACQRGTSPTVRRVLTPDGVVPPKPFEV
jgi:hypothetical protein